jgi:protein-arginine kinase activator protein McsA
MPYKDKERQREYMRGWHKRTWPQRRAGHKEQAKARYAALRVWFKALKSSLVCEECGEDHPACLEFHHTDPDEKDMAVTNLVSQQTSKERILAEISKCTVLCANCHRKLHYNS